jgi:hypothetical protein
MLFFLDLLLFVQLSCVTGVEVPAVTQAWKNKEVIKGQSDRWLHMPNGSWGGRESFSLCPRRSWKWVSARSGLDINTSWCLYT